MGLSEIWTAALSSPWMVGLKTANGDGLGRATDGGIDFPADSGLERATNGGVEFPTDGGLEGDTGTQV